MIGFIKLHRQLLDWEWYTDNNVKSVFLHLLLTANFKEKNWRGHTIKRGQTITGRVELAKTLKMSEQEVRTALKKLKKTKEITIKSTNKFSVVTLVNFEVYQDKQHDKQPTTNQQATNRQPASNQQLTTPKERKKDKKEENTPPFIETAPNLKSEANNSKLEVEKTIFNLKSGDCPFLADQVKNMKYGEWSDELINEFHLYCQHMKIARGGRWGNPRQLIDNKEHFNEQRRLFGEVDLIKHSSNVRMNGNVQINVQWYLNKLKANNKKEPKNTEDPNLLETYYKKHLKEAVLRANSESFKSWVVLYREQQNKLLELKLELNTKNPTLSTAFLFDFIHGFASKKAGSKPERRIEQIRSFYNNLSDYNRNKVEMRKLFIQHLNHY